MDGGIYGDTQKRAIQESNGKDRRRVLAHERRQRKCRVLRAVNRNSMDEESGAAGNDEGNEKPAKASGAYIGQATREMNEAVALRTESQFEFNT